MHKLGSPDYPFDQVPSAGKGTHCSLSPPDTFDFSPPGESGRLGGIQDNKHFREIHFASPRRNSYFGSGSLPGLDLTTSTSESEMIPLPTICRNSGSSFVILSSVSMTSIRIGTSSERPNNFAS